jgi:hypothetical protein
MVQLCTRLAGVVITRYKPDPIVKVIRAYVMCSFLVEGYMSVPPAREMLMSAMSIWKVSIIFEILSNISIEC